MAGPSRTRVSSGHDRLVLAGWLALVGSVVLVAVLGRVEDSAVRLPAASRQAAVTAPRATPAVTAQPTAPRPTLAGTPQRYAVFVQEPWGAVRGTGFVRIVASGHFGEVSDVAVEIRAGKTLVLATRVPVHGGEVRSWVRLEPDAVARAYRLRLLDDDGNELAGSPFIQEAAEPIVLTSPFLPDRGLIDGRLLVTGRTHGPTGPIRITLETLRGRVLARATTPVLEDSTRVPVQYVFWQTLRVDEPLNERQLRLVLEPANSDSDAFRLEVILPNTPAS